MSGTRTLPRLTRRSRSWVCTPPNGENAREFFDRANAEKAFRAGWHVELFETYIARINSEARS